MRKAIAGVLMGAAVLSLAGRGYAPLCPHDFVERIAAEGCPNVLRIPAGAYSAKH